MGYEWIYFIVAKSTNKDERPQHTSIFLDIKYKYW